jgi:tRNA (guanine37-N1)-methyltransferase
MKFNIITIFPEVIRTYTDESILGRGRKAGVIEINAVNLRDFADGKHRNVDDTPYGGGAGMVMKPEPIYNCLVSLDALKVSSIRYPVSSINKRTILMSPRGRQFDQRLAEEFAGLDEFTIVCGRYEGVDQRVVDHMVDEEVSVGPYVLAGGELGALIVTEAVSRLIPGVLGNVDSLREETHSVDGAEYPQYTKPENFHDWNVPDILLSGNHAKIDEWRRGLIRKRI